VLLQDLSAKCDQHVVLSLQGSSASRCLEVFCVLPGLCFSAPLHSGCTAHCDVSSFAIFYGLLVAQLIFMDGLTPLRTVSSSSLAHRRTTGVRQVCNDAVGSPYHSLHQHRLQCSPSWNSLQDVSNIPWLQIQNPVAGPSVEDGCSGFGEAECERQAALQETPSRRDNVFLCSHGTRTERCPPHQALPRVLNQCIVNSCSLN
jgi:hypothetical protein